MEYAKYGEHSHMQVHLRLKLSIDDKHVFYIWDFLVIFCLPCSNSTHSFHTEEVISEVEFFSYNAD